MNSPVLIRPRQRAVRLSAALLSLMLCAFSALPAFAEDDAKAIMARVYQQDTSHDVRLRATLAVTDKDGQTVRKKFTLSRIGSFGNGKTLVRFTDPPDLRGVTLLAINEPGLPDRQWIYTPATDRVRSVTPRERLRAFCRKRLYITKTSPNTRSTISPIGYYPLPILLKIIRLIRFWPPLSPRTVHNINSFITGWPRMYPASCTRRCSARTGARCGRCRPAD